MSEEKEEEPEQKRTKVGKTLSVSFSVDAILLRLAPDAKDFLDKLDKKIRQAVMQKAIEISKEKGRDYDVIIEDVRQAKNDLEKKER